MPSIAHLDLGPILPLSPLKNDPFPLGRREGLQAQGVNLLPEHLLQRSIDHPVLLESGPTSEGRGEMNMW